MASDQEREMANPHKNKRAGWTWFRTFQYNKKDDKPADARNVLLIVAALITAVIFEADVNPPGGVWQDSDKDHTAGRAIYASHKEFFYVFFISNTVALSSSILVIISLTYRFPFHFELWVSTVFMVITYGSAIFAITPNESKFRYLLTTAALPFLVRFIGEVFKWCKSQNSNSSVEPRLASNVDDNVEMSNV
ncbi:uncharacterized protein LOC132803801 [Ziziphus jujuba]|uniref:Uncharacterized protein LOC132803801 n=1 Tax=Ziziphus jujuba TaxID=326968 RepID=A0ABM4A9C2_ZIZJJ|nr:uncharacterized protein LOC132803801 [Ziziphus jujuba]